MVHFNLFRCFPTLISFAGILSRHVVHAAPLFDNSTIPSNLTVACSNALLQDVNCSPAIMGLQYGRYYSQASLQRVCTSQCDSGLAGYEAAVRSACTGQSWIGFEDESMPLDVIPGTIRYQYNATCLMDNNRYCNVVAAQAAAAADPDRMALLTFPSLISLPNLVRPRPGEWSADTSSRSPFCMRSLFRQSAQISGGITLLRWSPAIISLHLQDF